MKRAYPGIEGHVQIRAHEPDHNESVKTVTIHGDPRGLRSMARLLNALADLDQKTLSDYPDHAQEHVHMRPDYQLSLDSDDTIIGRLDTKAGKISDQFIPREHDRVIPST